MFEKIRDRLGHVFKKLKGQGRLKESNIQEALRDVRIALLEADVHYKVTKDLIEAIKVRAIGKEVLESLTPGQHFVKIVKEELTRLMGGDLKDLSLKGPSPVTLMLVGLQGSGKTTTAAKLGRYLSLKKGRTPLLIPADPYRPAATLQLQSIGKANDIEVFEPEGKKDPRDISRSALEYAGKGFDTTIVDTAGRLHIDNALMDELSDLKAILKPQEILLVVDAMTGQDAVKVAESFNDQLGIDGVILTKMDGDARGGAALSMTSVIGSPVKFIGTGEKADALEPFHPDRMASRILGMGDVLTLIEQVQETTDRKATKDLEKRLRKNAFTLEDFKAQMQQIKKMGSLENIVGMIPGLGKLQKSVKIDPENRDIIKVEAIINSMTKRERINTTILNGSRRKRIAMGSGTTVQDVNRVIKQYLQIKDMIKKMNKKGSRGFMGLKRGMLPFNIPGM
ncbi:MAG: signal recognition particle protein [Thermodesulfobacteriota bacterium]